MKKDPLKRGEGKRLLRAEKSKELREERTM